MIALSSGQPHLLRYVRWISPILLGTSIGIGVVAGTRLGAWQELAQAAWGATSALNRLVGPVWIPMLGVGMRVAWLSGRALRSRSGRGQLGLPVRPELGHLAPLFAALGLCGTVWGLMIAFEALQDGEFLTQLPMLLSGLGAAMTSTLVGLGLQITTLLLATINPAWSWVRIGWRDGKARYTLDARALQDGDEGLERLVKAIQSRQPEALGLAFDRGVPAQHRSQVRDRIWQLLDSAIPLREVSH